jgi:hypothetical protein
MAQPDRTKPIHVVTKKRADRSIVQQMAMCPTCAALAQTETEESLGTLEDQEALVSLRDQLDQETDDA